MFWPFARRTKSAHIIFGRVREALTSSIPDEHGQVVSGAGLRCVRCGKTLSRTEPAWYHSGWTPDPDDVTGSGFIFLCFPACARALRDEIDRDLKAGTDPKAAA